MEQKNQVSHDDPSLLMLNNDCLYPIFEFLQIEDFVNLAETCSRLLFVAQICKKFKNIEVRRCKGVLYCGVEKFSNNLSVIGEHVASVYVDGVNANILKTIADACTNLRSVELHNRSIAALPFHNLHELKLWREVFLSTDEWKTCFENNPGIVCLQYWDDGRNKCLPLLQLLPGLISLKVCHLELKTEEFHHLSCLTNLTRFSFTSEDTCYNQLLIELAENLNLVELDFEMACDADTFAALKSFRCLEVLSIEHVPQYYFRLPETAIFPSTLKKIRLDIDVSFTVFLPMVKQLKHLEEFDIGCGQIIWDNDKRELFPRLGRTGSEYIKGSRIVSRIANEMRAEKRKIKIIFYYWSVNDHQVWKYSDNLEIIQRPRSVERTFDHTFHLQ